MIKVHRGERTSLPGRQPAPQSAGQDLFGVNFTSHRVSREGCAAGGLSLVPPSDIPHLPLLPPFLPFPFRLPSPFPRPSCCHVGLAGLVAASSAPRPARGLPCAALLARLSPLPPELSASDIEPSANRCRSVGARGPSAFDSICRPTSPLPPAMLSKAALTVLSSLSSLVPSFSRYAGIITVSR